MDCLVGNREVVVRRIGSNFENAELSPSHSRLVLKWSSRALPLAIDVHYQTDKSHPYIFKWLEVTNQGAQQVRILRAQVEDFRVSRGVEPMRGGVGQPVFLLNKFFFGIEDPAAADEVIGQNVLLSQYPDAAIAPQSTWKSARSVVGAVLGNHQSVEEAFRRYLISVTGRSPVYRPIYCDWAAHDELGTLIKPQLTESLTESMLKILESMKLLDGIQFRYYLVDAFWYDPKGAYITFKKPNWPDGFGPAQKKMMALGMKPGLWFDISCMPHPKKQDIFINLKETPGWHGPPKPCLSDPELSEFLEQAIAFQIRTHDLGLLKFDFANMLCRNDAPLTPSLAILEKNAEALLGIIQKVREIKPAIVIRAYNGFSSGKVMASTIPYDHIYPISPWWVMWFDSIYSGDPRPADEPSFTDLRDSIICYQDHVARGYMQSLMPSFSIDDSGTLVGKTSTIYYIGSDGFTDSWIMNIMRGNLAPELYGDLRLLTTKDRQFISATLNFLRTHQGVIAKTQPILGDPGRGQVYGYLAVGKEIAFVTIVNPGLYPQSFVLAAPSSLPSGSMQKLLFSNDGERNEPTPSRSCELSGTLIPGEIRVYALGPRAKIASLSLPSVPTRIYHAVTSFENPFRAERVANVKITPDDMGKTLAFVIQYRKNGEPDRSYTWPENVMKVTGMVDSRVVSFTSIPARGTDIWSKCSWAVFKHQVSRAEINKTLRLTLVGNPPSGTQWQIQAFWLR